LTSRQHSQHVFSSALSAPAVKGASDDGQPPSRSAVPKQPLPHRFQPKMFLAIACVLALMVLKALPCSAQAEIDQDHYEMTNQQLIPPAHNSAIESERGQLPRQGHTALRCHLCRTDPTARILLLVGPCAGERHCRYDDPGWEDCESASPR